MHIPDEVVQAVLAAEPKTEAKVEVSAVVETLKETPATSQEIAKTLIEQQTNTLINNYVGQLLLDYPEDQHKPETTHHKHKKHTPFKKPQPINEELNLVECLEKTKTFIEGLDNPFAKKTAMKHLSNPFMLRPGAFIAKIIDLSNSTFEQVDNLDRLHELFSKVDSSAIKFENFYYGTDRKHVKLFRINLPHGYLASVSNIKLKDMPRQYFHEGKVKMNIKKTKKIFLPNRLDLEICCDEASPILSTQPGMEDYNVMSVKIDKKTDTILSWMPGMHPKHYNYNFLQEHTCVLGKWA